MKLFISKYVPWTMSQFLAQCGVMGSLNRSAQNGLAIILKMNWIFADSYLNLHIQLMRTLMVNFDSNTTKEVITFLLQSIKIVRRNCLHFFCHLLKQTMALFNDDTWSFYVSSNFWLLYLLIGLQVLWFDETTF